MTFPRLFFEPLSTLCLLPLYSRKNAICAKQTVTAQFPRNKKKDKITGAIWFTYQRASSYIRTLYQENANKVAILCSSNTQFLKFNAISFAWEITKLY